MNDHLTHTDGLVQRTVEAQQQMLAQQQVVAQQQQELYSRMVAPPPQQHAAPPPQPYGGVSQHSSYNPMAVQPRVLPPMQGRPPSAPQTRQWTAQQQAYNAQYR